MIAANFLCLVSTVGIKKQISDYLKQQLETDALFSVDKKAKKLAANFAYAALAPGLLAACDIGDWKFEQKILSHHVKPPLKAHPEIKNVIAVSSGKGGVGKSTTAISLALALSKLGARVGLLDADIYGPSQPLMLGLAGQQPEKLENDEAIPPLMAHGIQSISIGYLLEAQDSPTIWRGPMVSRALTQLFYNTKWQGLDYLIIDMPPGTGDIPLTLMQKIPLTAAVVCTTPQDIALLDARKAYRMFEKINIPVLGVIENMASFVCPHCGEQSYIFGCGGGEKIGNEYGLSLLGKIPLTIELRELTDKGAAIELFNKDSELGNIYQLIAAKMTAKLSKQKKDYSTLFGAISVSK